MDYDIIYYVRLDKQEREGFFMTEVSGRSFEYANKVSDGFTVVENNKHLLAYPDAQLPEYQT